MTIKTNMLPLIAALGLSACVEYGVVPLSLEPFRADAEQGDAFAQAQLGQHYLMGVNGTEDLEMAVYWLERAAAQNEGQAIYVLGSMREQGHGFKQDKRAAYEFYVRAAKLNNPAAQEALARYYAIGVLGEVDHLQSHKWQLLSDRHGSKFRSVDFLARRHLSVDQLAQAEAAADAISATF